MRLSFWADRLQRREVLPKEIYISLVGSLYQDERTLLFGSIGVAAAAVITAVWTDEAWLLLCATAMPLIGYLRVLDVRRFNKRRESIKTVEAARVWELRYVAGAAATVLLIGAWCFATFLVSPNPFLRLLSFAATLAYLTGISGRNFSSPMLVHTQIIGAAIPLSLAMMAAGTAYWLILAVVIVPLLLSIKSISGRLRRTLFDALISARDVALLANRFDTALNNMPLGLMMFDADHSLVVANNRIHGLFGASPDTSRRGASVKALLDESARAQRVAEADVQRLTTGFEERLSRRVETPLTATTEDGRSLSFTFEAMNGGGSVVLIEDVTERRAAEAAIRHLARYDPLTKLPNRTHFREEIMRVLVQTHERRERCAILFIDLDQFKQVNDTLGHSHGDELLCAVADRLRTVVRDSDLVARLGGDEFVIVQSPMRRSDQATSLAKRIVSLLNDTFDVDGHQVIIGASVGIAIAPRDGIDADTLLKNADMALYRAKADGRGTWRFFEKDMDIEAKARRSLELDLRNALAAGAFDVFYQPVVNLRTQKIASFEALLRWSHPERGMVSPADFVPVAEEMGIIVEIGNLVLQKACLECMKWPSEVHVAVNISSTQFSRSDVTKAVRHALSISGLPATRLEIEITETTLLQNTHSTRVALETLREMGVRISLDDFGTGYSSLSYLHNFPLDKVKIDRSFLKGIGSSERSLTLLHGVARLSSQLGMTVVMEGVETEEQLQLIAAKPGVDQVQGYLFSPAVPASEVPELLAPAAAQRSDVSKWPPSPDTETNIVRLKTAASFATRRGEAEGVGASSRGSTTSTG
ncbi:MAG: EAL domain-containing protein [Hyphomicrobiales bacterium]|nr:EAL domain-containing protein [Hyphomicrobiales bacterium]